MADQLNTRKARMGVVIPVQNSDRKPTEATKYYAVKVEQEDGNNECWLLLTTRELYQASTKLLGGWGSELKAGRLYMFTGSTAEYASFLVKLERPTYGSSAEYETVYMMLPERLMAKGIARATKNPEDIPGQSWWSDLLD